MYDGMRTTNTGAAIYFLFIVVIGSYVIRTSSSRSCSTTSPAATLTETDPDWRQANVDRWRKI
jgi:hypothetical protein